MLEGEDALTEFLGVDLVGMGGHDGDDGSLGEELTEVVLEFESMVIRVGQVRAHLLLGSKLGFRF